MVLILVSNDLRLENVAIEMWRSDWIKEDRCRLEASLNSLKEESRHRDLNQDAKLSLTEQNADKTKRMVSAWRSTDFPYFKPDR